MSKANAIYIIMITTFVAGLWAILSFGSVLLHAPTDLAGKWELRPVDASADTAAAHTMLIQQSGRYFEIAIDGKDSALKLVSEQLIQNTGDYDEQDIELAGEKLKMTFQGRANGEMYHVQTHGDPAGEWDAIRVNATYPRKLADRPTTKPVVNHAR
jgi:hypothetical protein